MQDPKFKFGSDDTIYRRDGSPPIPFDEPVILLRGKDQVTLYALREYVRVMRSFPSSQLAREHAESVTERIESIEKWQAEHPGRVGMGCHTCERLDHREQLPL
jgi:hypothetical protein